MRQRITFFQKPQDSIDPKLLEVTNDAISAQEIKAAREDRLTFGLEELPQELYRVLKGCHELHVRWVSPWGYEAMSPMISRLSPGLHVFYTPLKKGPSELLCPILKKAFGNLDCVSTEESFTILPSSRFAHSTSTHYHAPLEDLSSLLSYATNKLCTSTHPECLARATLLSKASTLDFDFDAISHSLTLTAYTPPSQISSLHISAPPNIRTEVGTLSLEEAIHPEEISLGGFLTVLGENDKPAATLFSFPSRHHPSLSTFFSGFKLPTGLHPTLRLQLSSVDPPKGREEEGECTLHTYLTLPRHIFADRYQLSDPLFLSSKNISNVHYISEPIDLEAPSYSLSSWGSSVLLSLSPTSAHAEIPLHLRYLKPNEEGHQDIEVPVPAVFWACKSVSEEPYAGNPFDRVNLGYEGLFGERTVFYHLSPEEALANNEGISLAKALGGRQRMMRHVRVPVLDSQGTKWIETGTAGVVVLGFLWVCWCLYGVWKKSGYGRVAKAETKKMQ